MLFYQRLGVCIDIKISFFQLQSLSRLTFLKGLSISMSAEKKMNDRKVIGTHDVREHISHLMTNTFVLYQAVAFF